MRNRARSGREGGAMSVRDRSPVDPPEFAILAEAAKVKNASARYGDGGDLAPSYAPQVSLDARPTFEACEYPTEHQAEF